MSLGVILSMPSEACAGVLNLFHRRTLAAAESHGPGAVHKALHAKAQGLWWAGKLQEALVAYEALLAGYPDDLASKTEYAQILSALGRQVEAEKALRSILAASPDAKQARQTLAEVLASRREWDEALAELAPLLAHPPVEPRAALLDADLRLWKGDFAPAEKAYRAILLRDPEDLGAKGGLGLALAQLGKTAEAEALLRQALDGKDERAGLQEALEKVRRREGAASELVRTAREAFEQNPQSDPLRLAFANALMGSGALVEAAAALSPLLVAGQTVEARREAFSLIAEIRVRQRRPADALPPLHVLITLAPKDPVPRRRLAAILIGEKRYQEAEAQLGVALRLAPEDLETLRLRAKAWAMTGEHARAAATLEKLKGQAPQDPDLWLEWIEETTLEGDPAKAVEGASQFLAAHSGDVRGYLARARALASGAAWSGAAEDYRRVLAAKPEEPEAALGLAHALLETGDYEAARREAEAVLGHDRGNAGALLIVGRAAQMGGNLEEAESFYRKALARAPRVRAARAGLAEVFLASGREAEAVPLFELLLAEDGSDARLRADLARALARAGETERAEEEIARLEATAPGSFTARLARADVSALEEKGEEAERLYRALVEEVPESREAALGLGRSLIAAEAGREAVELFEKLVARSPDDEEARLYLALALGLAGEFTRADEVLKGLLGKNVSGAKVEALRGDVRLWAGDSEGAARHYRVALERAPSDAGILRKLGQALLQSGKRDEAFAAYERLIELAPRAVGARADYAKALALAGRLDEARAQCARLDEEAPDSPEAFGARAEMWIAEGELARANALLEEAHRASPKNRDLTLRLAKVKALRGDVDGALSLYQEMIAANPRDEQAALGEIETLGRAGRYGEAAEKARQLVALNPTNRTGRLGLADALGHVGRAQTSPELQEAETVFGALLEEKPGDRAVRLAYADALAAHGLFERAAGEYGRLLEVDPRDADALMGRAPVFDRLRRRAEAVADYEAYLALKPDDIEAWREKARALGRAGQWEEADSAYAEAVRRSPRGDTALALERDAKEASRDGASLRAVADCESWLRSEPRSQEARWELAQARCRAGQNDLAASEYDAILEADPWYEEAAIGREDARLAARPAARLSYRYLKSNGFDRQIAFGVHEGQAGFTMPLTGTGRTSASFDYTRAEYFFPRGEPGSSADRYELSARHLALNGVSAEGFYSFNDTDDPWRSNHNFGASVAARVWDWLTPKIGYERRDLVENRTTLARNLYADRVYLRLEAPNAWRRLSLDGGASYAHYRDDNWRIGADAGIDYAILPFPRTLKVGVSGRYFTFGDPVQAYFSPTDYARGDFFVAWRHDLARDLFCGAPELYYQLKYAIGVDRDSEVFHTGVADLRFDLSQRVSLKAGFEIVRSGIYRSDEAGASLEMRF